MELKRHVRDGYQALEPSKVSGGELVKIKRAPALCFVVEDASATVMNNV